MRLPIFLLLFATGLVLTFVVLQLGLRSGQRGQVAPLLFALSAGGLIVWALVSMTAFNVTEITDCSTTVSHSYPSLAGVGAIGGALNLFAMVKAAAATLDLGGMQT